MFIQREQNLEQTKTYDQWHRARERNAASNLPLAVVRRINLSLVRYFTLVFPVNKQNGVAATKSTLLHICAYES